MRKVFSDFVRSLDNRGELQDTSLWEPMWRELCRELRRELRRRGLWELSPSILGIVGMARWQGELGEVGSLRGRSLEALDELAAGAYTFIFISRHGSLRRHLESKGEIEGLVRCNVRHFVYETQRRHDPVGTRVFCILKAGVEEALRTEKLFLLAGGPKISNATVLGTHPRAALESVGEEVLGDLVKEWNDAFLPEMMSADGPRRAELITALAGRLEELGAQGIRVFTFGDLISPLKADVRRRWAAILGTDPPWRGEVLAGDGSEVAVVSEPVSRGLEARDRFDKLSHCVERRLVQLPGQRRTQSHRLHLWRYLHRFSWEEGTGDADLPSHRELARTLGIPRERFRELYDTIKGELAGCLRALGEHSARARSTLASAEGSRMDRAALRDRLLAATAESLAGQGEWYEPGSNEPGSGVESGTRSGEIHTLRETSEEGIEWLILEVDSEAGARVAPVDTFPLVGSRDLEISAIDGVGSLVFRLGAGGWISADRLGSGTLSLSLPPRDLERVLVRRSRLAAGLKEATLLDEEVDIDPEYLDWCQVLDEAFESARRVVSPVPIRERALGAESARDPETKPYAHFRSLALAATIALACAGGWLSSRFSGISIADLDRRQARELETLARAAAARSANEEPERILEEVPTQRFHVLSEERLTRGGSDGEGELVIPEGIHQLHLVIPVPDREGGDRLTLLSRDLLAPDSWRPLAVFPVDFSPEGALVPIPVSLISMGGEYRLQLSHSGRGEILKSYRLQVR